MQSTQSPSKPSRAAVVGSGPAGVACAMALIKQGIEVTIFDSGEHLEPERAETVRHMATVRPSQWSDAELHLLRDNVRANPRGIPEKLVFGSNFPSRDSHGLLHVEQKQTELIYSLAEGGLSTVWGSNVFPWRETDFAGWPIQLADLEAHYKAILSFMPLAAVKDDLASDYPLYHDEPGYLRPSRQAQEFLADLDRGRSRLRKAGMTFGGARLAVRTARVDDPTSGCEYCGQCLYGCPYAHIYSTASTLQKLIAQNAVEYKGGWFVEKFDDQGERVRLHCRQPDENARRDFDFDRVFIAAGVIPTARLVLHSLNAYDTPVVLKDSQYFIVPFLRWKATKGVREEALYSLSQVVMEVDDLAISKRGIQMQFYTYSHIYEKVLSGMAPQFLRLMPAIAEMALSRLQIVQGYLHSDESSTMTMMLNRDEKTGGDTLRLRANFNPKTRSIVSAVMRKMLRHAGTFGGLPVWPMLVNEPVGMSRHCGGSFPMSISPGPLQTDRIGRLGGSGRVHVVDASVLPEVAETTLTFTAMANAHRIGYEAALEF